MGHMTSPRPNKGQFVVRRVGCYLHIKPLHQICTFAIASYEDA